MKIICALLFMLLPVAALSQEPPASQPRVTAEIPEGDVVVGQPAIIRIKVLVPTFMPSPPGFPTLNQQDLLVRLPERASGPVSETIDGDTWSGVQRSYRLYPLKPGRFDFDAQDIAVTFADPDTNEPVQVTVPLPAISLNAVVPDGAQGLDPLIIASGFDVAQEVEGQTDMQAGDAITRRLTARISGTTPMLIPSLVPDRPDTLLRPYPKEPRFSETDDRGVLSGQRVDEVVYLAQDGGQTQLEPISVQWFNLTTNQVETIEIPAVELVLRAPRSMILSSENVFTAISYGALFILFLFTTMRWGKPLFSNWREAQRRRYRASEKFARVELKQALLQQDLSRAYSALEIWSDRSCNPAGRTTMETCLLQIGAARYTSDGSEAAHGWTAALAALDALEEPIHPGPDTLPPLNP